ncbi:hypothetical protein JQC91_11125 [Jannaschia sp. Os4]|uniref:hypothetical protein n=1 Tax=Jannaschia sp. Os4 TaxID=2807617 RepID=UPI00193A06FF|nr:hypothetical protein [Jannaschia sp. Os4]MBM2576854.1 hypothetical protein [Jannaschia sp. Os4]
MWTEFQADEGGAVTVDWVVLSAALVGFGLAVVGVVATGAQSASTSVRTLLESDMVQTRFEEAVEILANVTEGFTTTATITAGANFPDLKQQKQFSFQMDATLNARDEGILFEAGGTGTGTILYQYDGMLYLQSGKGNGTGPAADRGEALWAVEDGTYSIEGSVDANSGLALYVDGKLVSESQFTAANVAGGNQGTVAGGNSSVAINHGGFNQSSAGHPGAGDLNLYVDQTTGDVGAPG